MILLFLEFLGTTELMVILVVALVIFGPRKLPDLGRSLGRSLGEFKRASDDFKRTWEREVEVERIERETPAPSPLLPEDTSAFSTEIQPEVVARSSGGAVASEEDIASPPVEATTEVEASLPNRKRDWL